MKSASVRKQTIYFITGSSGVGKSTVLPLLKKILGSRYDVHDFDEKLTKKVAMTPALVEDWQRKTITFWKMKALKNLLNNKRTVIVGLVYPNEVIKIKPFVGCEFCFLDVSKKVLTIRLMKHRFSNAQKRKKLFLATGLTPQQFITKNAATIQRLRVETIQQHGHIIDTSEDVVHETAEKIKQWIVS